jgi:hypothetical protein
MIVISAFQQTSTREAAGIRVAFNTTGVTWGALLTNIIPPMAGGGL